MTYPDSIFFSRVESWWTPTGSTTLVEACRDFVVGVLRGDHAGLPGQISSPRRGRGRYEVLVRLIGYHKWRWTGYPPIFLIWCPVIYENLIRPDFWPTGYPGIPQTCVPFPVFFSILGLLYWLFYFMNWNDTVNTHLDKYSNHIQF